MFLFAKLTDIYLNGSFFFVFKCSLNNINNVYSLKQNILIIKYTLRFYLFKKISFKGFKSLFSSEGGGVIFLLYPV